MMLYLIGFVSGVALCLILFVALIGYAADGDNL